MRTRVAYMVLELFQFVRIFYTYMKQPLQDYSNYLSNHSRILPQIVEIFLEINFMIFHDHLGL